MRFAMYLRARPPSAEFILEQRANIARWAAEQRAEVVAVYEDQEEFGVPADRPAKLRMLEDARADPRSFDAIVVTNLNRLSRNMCELNQLESELTAIGVGLTATEHLPLDQHRERVALAPQLDQGYFPGG